MIFRLRKQNVDVIADGIDFDQGRIVIFENAGDVGVELAAFFIAKKLATALGAEYEMNNDVGEGLRHDVCRSYRAWGFVGTVDLGLRSRCSLQPSNVTGKQNSRA